MSLAIIGGRELSAERLLEIVRTMMTGARYCFVTTLDDTGQPRTRLVESYPPEPDMSVWIATNATTRKVGDIRRDNRAALAFLDEAGGGYAAIEARASLVDDLAEKRRRWNPDWQLFYPDGPDGGDFLLIKLEPRRIELMSQAFNVAMEPDAFHPAALVPEAGAWVLARE